MYSTNLNRPAEQTASGLMALCGFAAVVAGFVGYEMASHSAAFSQAYALAAVRPATQVSTIAVAPVRGVSRIQASAHQAGPYLQPVSSANAAVNPFSKVTSAFGAAALGLVAMAAAVFAISRKEQPIVMAATSGKRPVWIPGGQPPAHLTGEFPADRGFDPLGLAKDPATFERMRASEVFHGRLAMLGIVGCILPELQGKGIWYNVGQLQWGPGPNGEVISGATLFLIGMLFAYPVEYWRGNGGFGWFEEKGDRTYPGFDPLNLTDEYTKTAEIKNGRLAMLAMLGLEAQRFSTGGSPLENLAAVTGGSVAMFAASGERQLWFPGAKAPPQLTGEFPGDRGFDPVDFSADPETFERMRASEVFHGRLAMLGVVGCLVPELLGKGAWFEAGNSVDAGQLGLLFMLGAFPAEYWRGNGGFGWAQSEKQKGNRIYPGFDPMKMTNDDTKTKEIKNGRLAMIAMLGLFSQAVNTGVGPIANLLAGPPSVAMF